MFAVHGQNFYALLFGKGHYQITPADKRFLIGKRKRFPRPDSFEAVFEPRKPARGVENDIAVLRRFKCGLLIP